MNILEFDTNNAFLSLLNNEATIFRNALVKVINSIPEHEFRSRMILSRQEALILRDKLEELLNKNESEIKNRFGYQEVLVLNNSLNEICYRIPLSNFDKEIGYEVEEVKKLLESIFPLTEKMISDTIQVRIINRTRQLFSLIKPYSVKLPRQSQTRQECKLLIGKYRILFLLFSLKNSKTFSGIKIVVFNNENSKDILYKTTVQKIKISSLGDLISYFDEYMNSTRDSTILDEYIYSATNSEKANIFKIKVLSANMISEEERELHLHFNLNVDDEKKNDNHFDIRSIVDFNTIYEFTSTIKKYLINTVNES